MDMLQAFHMKGGTKESSYSNNSALQRKSLAIAKPIIEEAIQAMYCKTFPQSFLAIADLGCSSGPNTLLVISDIIDAVACERRRLSHSSPEFHVFFNDLPGNDFNTLFGSLPDFYQKLKEANGNDFGPCVFAGVPGSFYGRLFPSKTLHFVHSSYSLMWLSQVPPELAGETGNISNKGNIYMAETSPREVLRAYLGQFQKDFFMFLRSRSEEMVAGGRMVLTLLGRASPDPSSKECCRIWALLAQALNDMVSQGLIEEDKLESFNIPMYTPSPAEVKAVIEPEGSFIIHLMKTYRVSWDPDSEKIQIQSTSGEKVAKYMRAVAESLLTSHFGEAIIEELFQRYRDIVSDHMQREDPKFTNLVISIEKK